MRNVPGVMNRCVRTVLLGMCMALISPSVGANSPDQVLRERYAALEPSLRASIFDAPIHVESYDRNNVVGAHVHGVLPYPFGVVRATLQQLSAWCELVTLHFNVKGCVHRMEGNVGVATFFTGRKTYENPKKARQIPFVYELRSANAGLFDASFTSKGGVLDTRDYRLDVQAVPLEGKTFVHVSFSYRYGSLTRMASAAYYATLGRDKIGFSVVGNDKAGKPIHIKGRNAAIERSVMLSYLGLQTLFEGLAQPEPQRFEWRLRRWYALTGKYRPQLQNDVEMDDYLKAKRQERLDMGPGRHEVWPVGSK